jgi:hypothetical protein
MNGSSVMALDNNVIVTYGEDGSVLAKRNVAKLDMGSLVPSSGPFTSYNTTVSFASDGEYLYLYRASNGRIQKISGDNTLVAEYPFSPVSGPMVLRGNEVWASDPEIASKTLVISRDMKLVRELRPGVSNLALYDDKVLTSAYKDLTVRDADFKVIATANPLPANCYIHRMAAAGGKVAIVGYNMTRINNKSVNEHKVYLYDLTLLAPRGTTVTSPAPSRHSLALSPEIEWEAKFGGQGDQLFRSLVETDDAYVMAGFVFEGSRGYVAKAFKNGTRAWETTLSKYPHTYLTSITQASDGSYVAAGYANSTDGERFDIYMAKIGDDGNVVWETVSPGPGDERLYDLLPAGDTGFVVTGYVKPPEAKDSQLYMAWTDSDGKVTSSRAYGDDSSGMSMVATDDGGFVVTGHKDNKVCLLRVDKNGGVIWEKSHSALSSSPSCSGSCIIRTLDGGYAVAGSMMGPASGQTYTVNVDAILLKVDAGGNKEWGRAFDFYYVNGNSGNSGNSVAQTADGGFIMTGYSYRPNPSGSKVGVYSQHLMFVIKTDPAGILQWRKYIGGDELSEGWSVHVAGDGGYMIAGSKGVAKDPDAYLVRLESEHLSPAAMATATATASPGSPGSTVTPGESHGSSSCCCAAAILPLLLLGCAIAGSRMRWSIGNNRRRL